MSPSEVSGSDHSRADVGGADGTGTHASDAEHSGTDVSARGIGAATSDAAGLVRMLNQIAANVAHHPHDQAVDEIAVHLRSSWAPAMRAALDAHLDHGGPGLTPLAAAAAERLQTETPQTGRTRSSPA
jgi:formate dehydrogenase subunit delta